MNLQIFNKTNNFFFAWRAMQRKSRVFCGSELLERRQRMAFFVVVHRLLQGFAIAQQFPSLFIGDGRSLVQGHVFQSLNRIAEVGLRKFHRLASAARLNLIDPVQSLPQNAFQQNLGRLPVPRRQRLRRTEVSITQLREQRERRVFY
jgi:hypothetical protein